MKVNPNRRRLNRVEDRVGVVLDWLDMAPVVSSITSIDSMDSISNSSSSQALSSQNEDSASFYSPVKRKNHELLTLTTESLNHISKNVEIGSKEKYTRIGNQMNMSFKMVRSETKLIKTLLYSNGFTQASSKNPSANLIWCGAGMKSSKMRSLHSWQRLNQFPRSTELTHKDSLYENIARSQLLYKDFGNGKAFDFIPEFFVTPRDNTRLSTFLAENSLSTTLIVKPCIGSRGRGITFANSMDEIPSCGSHLVSRYLDRPLLVNGHKFDLRIYVAVTSFYPLVAYVYSEGLTRLASSKYDANASKSDEYVHLTNYSINKNSHQFIRNESMSTEDFGHKWTLGALLRHLESLNIDSKLVMIRIEDVIVKALLSIQGRVVAISRSILANVGTNFELFGFDILLDDELKPWLLEVNLSPSLSCDAPLDSLVKTRLVCDLLNLACIPLYNKKLQDARFGSEVETDGGDTSIVHPSPKRKKLTVSAGKKVRRGSIIIRSPTAIDTRAKNHYKRLELEKDRRGDFVRVFPRKNTLRLYSGIMEMESSSHEHFDRRLYEDIYGRLIDDELMDESMAELYHEVIMNTHEYRRFDSLPCEIRDMIDSWYEESNAYMDKITKEGEIYAASLPIVRGSARLRTKSCSEYYDIKKAIVSEKLAYMQDNKENNTPDAGGIDAKSVDVSV